MKGYPKKKKNWEREDSLTSSSTTRRTIPHVKNKVMKWSTVYNSVNGSKPGRRRSSDINEKWQQIPTKRIRANFRIVGLEINRKERNADTDEAQIRRWGQRKTPVNGWYSEKILHRTKGGLTKSHSDCYSINPKWKQSLVLNKMKMESLKGKEVYHHNLP